MKKGELKKMILAVLKDEPKTRDSDQYLTLKIWVRFYPKRIDLTYPKNPKVGFREIMDLPREDNVKRIRAVIQNDEGRFLPTSEKIAKQRKLNMEKWYQYIKYNINS